jgi:hypothetical protein
LHCYGLRGDIKFNPEFKCGALVSGQLNELQLPLRNEGPAEGSFQFLTTEDSIIKFNPPGGTLAAKGEKGCNAVVKVEINSDRVGSFREVVRVQLYADQPPKMLDCHGTFFFGNACRGVCVCVCVCVVLCVILRFPPAYGLFLMNVVDHRLGRVHHSTRSSD